MTTDEPIKNVPISAMTRFAAGQLAETRGDFATAIGQYKRALAIDPAYADALYRLGCVYSETRQYSEAITIWNRYLKATNNSAFAYNNLAYTEELAGNPVGAEADYKLGIAKEPTNQACRVNYGLMLARHGRMGESMIQLQAVLAPSEVHYNIAEVYELQKRPEMAKIEYQQALALDPNFKDAREKLASLGDMTDPD
jgi:tetratricopeptide (TPR) repeat protein